MPKVAIATNIVKHCLEHKKFRNKSLVYAAIMKLCTYCCTTATSIYSLHTFHIPNIAVSCSV